MIFYDLFENAEESIVSGVCILCAVLEFGAQMQSLTIA